MESYKTLQAALCLNFLNMKAKYGDCRVLMAENQIIAGKLKEYDRAIGRSTGPNTGNYPKC